MLTLWWSLLLVLPFLLSFTLSFSPFPPLRSAFRRSPFSLYSHSCCSLFLQNLHAPFSPLSAGVRTATQKTEAAKAKKTMERMRIAEYCLKESSDSLFLLKTKVRGAFRELAQESMRFEVRGGEDERKESERERERERVCVCDALFRRGCISRCVKQRMVLLYFKYYFSRIPKCVYVIGHSVALSV